MDRNSGPDRLTRVQGRAAMVAVALLALAGVWTLWAFLPAIGWAGVLGISLWPWYARLRARWPGHDRVLLPAVVTLLVLMMLVLPLIMVASAIAQDSAAFAGWLKQVSAQGMPAPAVLSHLPWGDQMTAMWRDQLGGPGALGRLAEMGGEGGALPLGAGGRFLGAVLHRVLLVAFTLLILFFLLRDGEEVARGWHVGGTRMFGPAGESVGEQIVQAIRGTVNGLVVVGLGEGVLLGLAYFAAGVPHPALLGLATGLLSAIPFGAVAAYVLAAGLLAANGQIGLAITIFAFGSFVVFIADHFVRPVLIGGSTRLPFLWVLLGILGGIEVWGLIGLVLGPALMAALVLLWREWIGTQPGPLNPPVKEADQPSG